MKKLGDYWIGDRAVRVFCNPDMLGGLFDQKDQIPTMVIGLGYAHWERVVAAAMHEAIEFAMIEVGARFDPSRDYGRGSDQVVFHADHSQFSEAVARAAFFLTKLLPDLSVAFRAEAESRKPKRKRRRRRTKKTTPIASGNKKKI